MKILGAETVRNNWGQVVNRLITKGFSSIRIQGHLKKSKHKDAAGSWRRDETQGLGLENPESHFPPTPFLFHPSVSLKPGFPCILGSMTANGLREQLPSSPLFHGDKQNEPGLFWAQF